MVQAIQQTNTGGKPRGYFEYNLAGIWGGFGGVGIVPPQSGTAKPPTDPKPPTTPKRSRQAPTFITKADEHTSRHYAGGGVTMGNHAG